MTTTIDVQRARRRAARVRNTALRTRCTPPPDLTVSEWADRYRHLSREASAEPGRWRTSRAPYQRGILDAFSDPMTEQVVVMSSAQVGKTETVLNVIGFFVDQDPAPILTLQPTVEMGQAFSKDRLAPMLRDSPKLRGRVAPAKSRDSGNTLLHKSFPGGHITISGSNSAASLASRPIRIVLCDEIDRYKESAGGEGDPVGLAFKRTSTFWNRKLGLFSTPTVKGFSRIEEAYEESDQRRYHVPCPHCEHLQTLKWRDLHYENDDPTTACYVCEECGCEIEEQDKLHMLEQGVWVAGHPGRRIAGFHLNALYSPWARWEELVREWLSAQGNPERLKVFVNTVLGETWEDEGVRIDAESLAARRATWKQGTAPEGVGALTAAVDVQNDRLELLVLGWGAGEESWPVDFQQLWGDPARRDVWDQLDELLSSRYPTAGGAALPVLCTAIDSGGHHTEQVYRFTKPRHGRRVYAIKGRSQLGGPLVSRPSKGNKAKVKVFSVGTEAAKDLIFARLRIRNAGPGYVHLPDWVDEEFIAQMTSEKVVTRYVRGRPTRRYEQTRPRNEALDLYVYNLAALTILGRGVQDRLAELAAQVAAEGAPESDEDTPQRPARRPSGWVNRWR